MRSLRFPLCCLAVALLFSCSVFSRESLDPAQEARGAQPPWQNEWTRGAVFYEIFVGCG
jgi:hypothetical protein